VAGVVLLVLAGISVPAIRTARVVWAQSYALSSLHDHVAVGDWEAAHRLANRVAAIIPGDPRVDAVRAVVSDTIAVEGDPAGARVYRRPYGGADSDWELLGHAPLGQVVVPRFPTISEFRIEADGFVPAYDIGAAPAQRVVTVPTLRYTLVRPGEGPAGMVRVVGGNAGTVMAQLNPSDRAILGDFWLDRFEVTNRDYQEFVDAGGYRDRHWWEHEFLDGDRRLTFEEAMVRFVDRTGRSGPALWNGEPPLGLGLVDPVERRLVVDPGAGRQVQLVAPVGRPQHLAAVQPHATQQRPQLARDGAQRRVPRLRPAARPARFRSRRPQRLRQLTPRHRPVAVADQERERRPALLAGEVARADDGVVAFDGDESRQVDPRHVLQDRSKLTPRPGQARRVYWMARRQDSVLPPTRARRQA
jgi:hypothetical protein